MSDLDSEAQKLIRKARTKLSFKGEVEVVEFYPEINKTCVGTLHIYLPEFLMDIRGVGVMKREKGKYFFQMPYRKTLDEEGKPVIYPILNFSDPDLYKSLIVNLRKAAKKYIDDILREKGLLEKSVPKGTLYKKAMIKK